jgi:hypothetical protein
VLGGYFNWVKEGATGSAILGGTGNTVTSAATNSVILGCSDITATTSNTVYACNIEAGNYFSGGTNLLDIFADAAAASNKYVTTTGFTGFVPQVITHNLNTATPIVQIIDATGALVIPHSVSAYTLNSVTVTLSPTDTYTVIVDGGGSSTGDLQSQYSTYRMTSGTGYTFTSAANTVVVNTSTATTVNLPAAPETNKFYIVKVRHDGASYPVTVNGNGNNIDDDTSVLINTTNTSITFLYDGVDYIII